MIILLHLDIRTRESGVTRSSGGDRMIRDMIVSRLQMRERGAIRRFSTWKLPSRGVPNEVQATRDSIAGWIQCSKVQI